MGVVLAIVGFVAAFALVAWFLLGRKQPERLTDGPGDHRAVDGHGRGTQSVHNVERPAGPDAENMAADPPGGRTAPGRPDAGRP